MRTALHHRHFLLAPLLVVTIFASAFAGGTVSHATEAETAVAEFHEGTVLLGGKGFRELRVGKYLLVGLHGAFHVTRGSDLTVAALSSPVIILDGKTAVLVPPGSQWKGSGDADLSRLSDGIDVWMAERTVSLLPHHFVERELERFSEMPVTEPSLPEVRSNAPASLVTLQTLSHIGAARERQVSAWAEDVLGALRGIVERGDHVGLDALLADPAYTEVLASNRAFLVIALLLSELPDTSALRMPLLGKLSESPDLWILASAHPRYQPLAWAIRPEQVDIEFVAARLAALLQWEPAQGPVRAFTAGRLQLDVLELLSSQEKAVGLITELLPRFHAVSERAESAGHPETARVLAGAFVAAAEEYVSILPEDLKQELDQMAHFGRIDPLAIDVSLPLAKPDTAETQEAAKTEDVAIPLSRSDTEILERKASLMLSSMGALFTVETEVRATSPGKVDIRKILFSSSEGDREASFALNVTDGSLSNIVVDAKDYPLDSPLEGFVTWVTQ